MRPEGQADWQRVDEASFRDEAHLQRLLYEDPVLIPFSDLGEAYTAPKTYVREAGLPGSGNTDLIGVDENGGITVIECKLATNSEQKRTVVGQVLEYAAFLWGMRYEDFEQLFEREYSGAGKSGLAELVASPEEGAWSEGDFRASVQSALDTGAFCLVIAVDSLNDELRRIIEYLNRTAGGGTTIYAVEVPYLRGDGYEALAPRLVGPATTRPPRTANWTEHTFFEAASTRCSAEALALMRQLYEFTASESDRLMWGRGRSQGSFTFRVERGGVKTSVFTVYTNGSVGPSFQSIETSLGSEARMTFADDLASIDGFSDVAARLQTSMWPMYRIEEALKEGALHAFKEAVRRVRDGAGT